MSKQFTRWLKAVICLLLCVNIISSVPQFARAQSAGNAEQEVYEELTISSLEEFLEFAANCRLDSYSQGLYVRLECDIDLSQVSFDGIPIFGGIFDGCGYSVSGLSVTRNGSIQGLFRYVQETAVVRCLNVSGKVSPSGSHSYVGGIAGENKGLIQECSFDGYVSGSEGVGGIAGRNEVCGIIESCTVSGTVHGDHFVGGIAGENSGVIRFSENNAELNTVVEHNSVDFSDVTIESITSSEAAVVTTDIGGVAGFNSGVIRECTNNGDVGYKHIGYNIGGIAGSQVGYITGCANYGSVHGRKEAGGIVGQMEPSTVVSYESDTMQLLEEQLGVLTGMINTTAANAQGSAGEISDQMSSLQGHVQNAQDAIEQIIPSDPEAEQPDEDTVMAAISSLSGSLSSMSGVINSMTQTGEESLGVLNDNMTAISGQMGVIGQTVADGAENLGGTIIDASDNDTDEDTNGKVEDCKNYGFVEADLNAGGIIGAMAIENDLDPEDDLQIFGNSSLNYECEARAVVLDCENYGEVSAKRQNAGGIAGWMSLGLLRQCVNTGAIEASGSKYVGGIAGQSNGYIRQCSAKCILNGSTYIGGIAGTADIVTDCRAMVIIESGTEKIGAVLGFAEHVTDKATEEEPQPISGNYYLAVEEDLGGVDGISYSLAAERLGEDDFYALEELDRAFRVVTVRFIFEDGSERVVNVKRGGELNVTKIPAVPEKEGYAGCWDGLAQTDLSRIAFDMVFRLEYIPYDSVIASQITRDNGLPLLLALGVFDDESSLTVEETSDHPALTEDQSVVEAWHFRLVSNADHGRLRYLMPDGYAPEELTVMVRDASGDWTPVPFETDGSYLVLSMDKNDDAICLVHEPEDYLTEIIAGGVIIILLGVITAITAAVRKRRIKE